MRILLLMTICGIHCGLSGCNEVAQNGQSKCFQQWNMNPVGPEYKLKDAVKCCMSYRKAIATERGWKHYNEFNVPLIVIKSDQPINTECRQGDPSRDCVPHAKCLPSNNFKNSLSDIAGFFNFLDLYRTIPFTKPNHYGYTEQNKTLNWECFNTNDNFDVQSLPNFPTKTSIKTRNNKRSKRQSIKLEKRIKQLEKRLSNNFCRSILYKYHTGYDPKSFKTDLCEKEIGKNVFPFQIDGTTRFSEFNRFEHNWERLNSPIYFLNKSNRKDHTKYVTEYDETRNKKSITVFQDYREFWEGVRGLHFQENSSRQKRRGGSKPPVHMATNCGCFHK